MGCVAERRPSVEEFPVTTFIDDGGAPFQYVHLQHQPGAPLVVHFSAFFGKWGDAKPYRAQFQGYFHRLRMLGSDTDRNWLFLCDPYGAFDNGTYYTGERGDFFVERAMLRILEEVAMQGEYRTEDVVLVGSSMGGTAALKFGLLTRARGVVAIGPHIDLDTSAAMQNRMAEVAYLVPDGDATGVHNQPFTRQITRLVEDWPEAVALPRLFVQSCADDVGVHEEQVLPLVKRWREHGGCVDLDVRPVGGHTSDYATRPLLLDAIAAIQEGREIDVTRYQTDPELAGSLTVPPLSHRVRRALSLTRKRLLRR